MQCQSFVRPPDICPWTKWSLEEKIFWRTERLGCFTGLPKTTAEKISSGRGSKTQRRCEAGASMQYLGHCLQRNEVKFYTWPITITNWFRVLSTLRSPPILNKCDCLWRELAHVVLQCRHKLGLSWSRKDNHGFLTRHAVNYLNIECLIYSLREGY